MEMFGLLGEIAVRAVERKKSHIGNGLLDKELSGKSEYEDKLEDFLVECEGAL